MPTAENKICPRLTAACVKRVYSKGHWCCYLTEFNSQGKKQWHARTRPRTHTHNNQQTPWDHRCQLFNKVNPPLKYKGYQINHIHKHINTHTHTQLHTCDWCVAQRPQFSTDGLNRKKETSATLNYFLLISCPACGSNNTHGPTAVQQREKQSEGSKDCRFN